MAEKEPPFVLYMCFETDHEHDICRSLAVVSGRSDVEKWKTRQRDIELNNDESNVSDQEADSSNSPESDDDGAQRPFVELAQLMSRFRETMSSYRPLVEFGMMIMPTLRFSHIYNQMYKNAERQLAVVEKDEKFETYGVTVDQYQAVNQQLRRLREFDRGATVLPGAILLSLVATFDSFIADTARIMLRRRPEKIIESSKSISVKDVLSMASFDDVIDKVTEDEVENLMRGSHDEQIKYIEDKMDVNIRSNYDEWGEFIEVFERRNLIAHGNYVINTHYIRNCSRHGFHIEKDKHGEKLSLDGRYLRQSSDRLLEFGLSLMFVLWLKHFRNDREEAYDRLNEITYELIKDKRSRVAARLLDLALFKQTPTASDKIKKMMTVNLANAYKKLHDEKKAYEVIGEVDWSAATDDFQICVAAVRGDVDRVVELMPRVIQGELIKKADFREWPIFDWVREEGGVQEKFQDIFGEPMLNPTDEEGISEKKEVSTMIQPRGSTIH